MARILYAVMGNTHGHIMRSLALARRLPEHTFHFVGGGRVPAAVAGTYPCLEVPVLRTVHRDHRVSVPAVVGQIAARVAEAPGVLRRIQRLIREWKPDIALIDREFYTPLACPLAGLPCLALNHSGLLLSTRYPVPRGQRLSWALAMANDRALFDFTPENWSVSFYHPPLRGRKKDRLFPPVVRAEVTRHTPREEGHILVYLTSRTSSGLIDALQRWGRPAVVYGHRDTEAREGCLHFKPYSFEGILDDLASCRFAVVNGGHNLISESLYFGKPVLCFPIHGLFEQFLNAHYIRELGLGDYCLEREPDPAWLDHFESRQASFRAAIGDRLRFDGTDAVVAALQERLAEF